MNPERPRDALGRPLPAGADPSAAVAGVSMRPLLSDEEAWTAALAYLDDGFPFHAHEVCELRWRACPPEDRAAWQALAQWGAALTHAARGNRVGAASVAARARENLAAAPRIPACVDVPRVRSSCQDLIGDEDS